MNKEEKISIMLMNTNIKKEDNTLPHSHTHSHTHSHPYTHTHIHTHTYKHSQSIAAMYLSVQLDKQLCSRESRLLPEVPVHLAMQVSVILPICTENKHVMSEAETGTRSTHYSPTLTHSLTHSLTSSCICCTSTSCFTLLT